MKKFQISRLPKVSFLLIYVVVFFSGCQSIPPSVVSIIQTDGKNEASMSGIKPKQYEEKELLGDQNYSNLLYPHFIEKTLLQMQLSDYLIGAISKNYKIAVYPLDRVTASSVDAYTIVERTLIRKLLEKGYFINNRNSNILRQSAYENNGTPLYFADTLLMKDINAKFPSSDIILGYRLLELGCQKFSIPKSDSVKRVGSAMIELTVVVAKTQQVLYDDVYNAYLEDYLPTALAAEIENFHYSFKSYNYYVGTPSANSITTSETPKVKIKEEIKSEEAGTATKAKYPILEFVFSDISSTQKFKIVENKNKKEVHQFEISASGLSRTVSYKWSLLSEKGEELKPGLYDLMYKNETRNTWILMNTFNVKPW